MYTYSQGAHTLSKDGVLITSGAYSGYQFGLNNPIAQDDPDIGPIPEGTYKWGKLLAVGPGHTGTNVLPIEPDEATRAAILAIGRGPDSFFGHGDTASDVALHLELASRGCIIMPLVFRLKIAESGDTDLTVVE